MAPLVRVVALPSNPSFLSSRAQGSAYPVETMGSMSAVHVSAGASLTMEYCALTGCRLRARSSSASSNNNYGTLSIQAGGAAVFNSGGTLVMRDCNVSDAVAGCATSEDGDDCGYLHYEIGGGAIRCEGGGVTLLENSIFTDCRALNEHDGEGSAKGGAVYVTNGTLVARGCTFSRNGLTNSSQVQGEGGALRLRDSVCLLERCVFKENYAPSVDTGVSAAPKPPNAPRPML